MEFAPTGAADLPPDLPTMDRLPGEIALLRERVAELEMRLRRIATQLHSAGVWPPFDVYPGHEQDPRLADLTTRQWEILGRIAHGQRVATIADALFVSPSTVRNHLHVIFRKFGVHSQAELVEEVQGMGVARLRALPAPEPERKTDRAWPAPGATTSDGIDEIRRQG